MLVECKPDIMHMLLIQERDYWKDRAERYGEAIEWIASSQCEDVELVRSIAQMAYDDVTNPAAKDHKPGGDVT